MRTLPKKESAYVSRFDRGVEGIKVFIMPGSYPNNPYRDIFTFCTQTWGYPTGNPLSRWKSTDPETRLRVVKAVMEKNSLPLSTEILNFTFYIEGISRWAFDQIVRSRIGVTFSGSGTGDTNRGDANFRIPENIYKDEELLKEFKRVCLECKEAYRKIVESGGDWVSARTILPVSIEYQFQMHVCFSTLQLMCSKRMCFAEFPDTVAFAWLLRKEMKKYFPFLANYLRPMCDFAGKCLYHKPYSDSECFGCLFRSCGRNKKTGIGPIYNYSTFDSLATNPSDIKKQLKIEIPESWDWKKYNSIDDLEGSDRILFRSDD